MTSKELRTAYLKFFESKGHLIHASDSLVPSDDPSLLYTSAGMVQFKPYFTGQRVPLCTRIVTSQKCMRTDDIEEVGDAVHHTFFEMLGNFSFGDYFKREAITWAWEFLTEVIKINPDSLWTSIYLDDDEAYNIWVNEVKFPAQRIVRLGEDKNYWPANAPSKGPNGVCGPCNEIFLDVSPELGMPEDPAWSIAHDSNRFVEIWNLVFTQFDRQEDGTLKPLPNKNIDTGMGLERTVAVLAGAQTNYETDLFLPIIHHIEEISGAKYGSSDEVNRAIRIIADHIRATVFTIADGVMPSNVGRGYVLRRLIRNAVVTGRKLGIEKPFMAAIVPTVVKIMGDVYHEIADRESYIEKLMQSEEEKFRSTLQSGLQRLEDQIAVAASSEEQTLDGETVFTLYDTYGFPVELTKSIAAEMGISVDMEGFRKAMEEQRRRAKDASDFGSVMSAGGDTLLLELEKTIAPSKFTGYDETVGAGTVLAIVKGGEFVASANAGDEVEIVLDQTPFYAESGGQVGDTGELSTSGAQVEVFDTAKVAHFFFHRAKVASGMISVGDQVEARVDVERRMDIARNHTATHLLHAALHKMLGEHALQKGSVVEPGRLRFDFSHFQAVTPEEIRAIEDEVNAMVLQGMQAQTTVTSVDEARKLGAMALFGEKYGAEVRVVRMGDTSVELCGGTHLCNTCEVGFFKIVSESSVGAGLRRFEGVTGRGAVAYVHGVEDTLREVASMLGVTTSDAPGALERVQSALKDAQKQIDKLQSKSAAEQAGELAEKAEVVGGVNVVTSKVATANAQVLSGLADSIADKLKSGIVVLGGVEGGKVLFIGKVTQDLIARGFHAGNMLREVAKVAGGGGGGKPEFAQAGGKDASKVEDALAVAIDLVKKQADA